MKYGIYYGPEGLSKREKEVFMSGKLPRRVKTLVDSKFKGTHALLSGVLGYKLEDAITLKTRTWLIYKLPKEVPQFIGRF